MFSRRDTLPHLWDRYGLSPAERTFIIHADEYEAIDIDTASDFADAKKYTAGYRRVQRPLSEHFIDNWQLIAPRDIDWEEFINFLDPKLEDSDAPLLILDDARPPLTFLRIEDGCQRRPWISPEASTYLHSPKVVLGGNLQHMPCHFFHIPYYRVKRERGVDNYRQLGKTDAWGGFHGLNGSSVPMKRVIFMDEFHRQTFFQPPHDWIKTNCRELKEKI
jgi:hypothetical protein